MTHEKGFEWHLVEKVKSVRFSFWIAELARLEYATVYSHESLAYAFLMDTGHRAPWEPVKASEDNKTVGRPGGLIAPLLHPDELVVTGHVIVESIAMAFCKQTTFEMLSEPSARFKAALADLKRESL